MEEREMELAATFLKMFLPLWLLLLSFPGFSFASFANNSLSPASADAKNLLWPILDSEYLFLNKANLIIVLGLCVAQRAWLSNFEFLLMVILCFDVHS